MSVPRARPALLRTDEVLARVRVAVIGVPVLAVACGALALQGSTRLALVSAAVALGWTRLTDP